MAFTRHQVEKNRLIEMVRQSPILWDCRLPHYKRSDKKKDIKWCELGRVFNVSGERVKRTFTSLREIFRRELNHEKLLGARFISKWEYYGAMSFLKDVIRERKTRERYRNDGLFKDKMNDSYSYSSKNQNGNCLFQPDAINDSSSLINNHRTISSSRSSTTPSLSIKEEPTDHEGDDECNEDLLTSHKPPSTNPNKRRRRNNYNHHHYQSLQNDNYNNNRNDISSPGPTPSTSTYRGNNAIKNTKNTSNFNLTKEMRRGGSNEDDVEEVLEGVRDRQVEKEEEEQEEHSTKAKFLLKQTPREILYRKFGEFLSARLNTLSETVANDLVNRILLLVAENR